MTIKFQDDCECREYFKSLQREFEAYWSGKLAYRTIYKHSVIIGLLIDFLCCDCAVRSLDDLTVGMVNSRFRRWHISKVGDEQESSLKTAVKKFFLFLAAEKGFDNKKIMDSFKKR